MTAATPLIREHDEQTNLNHPDGLLAGGIPPHRPHGIELHRAHLNSVVILGRRLPQTARRAALVPAGEWSIRHGQWVLYSRQADIRHRRAVRHGTCQGHIRRGSNIVGLLTPAGVLLDPDPHLDVQTTSGSALPRWAVAGALASCAALAIVCRIPFLDVPLTNDEGGYAYVARLWAMGAHLYGQAWVDRPQALVLLFRLVVAVAPSTHAMREFAAVYAVVNLLLLAYVATRLYGRAAGICAAALYGLFSSGPQIEGFIVNGELLATLPTLAAIGFLLKACQTKRSDLSLALAGFAAGVALLVKQSAIDAVALVVLFAPAGEERPVGDRIRREALALAGLTAALALSALFGAITGWHNYINAVLVDSLRYRSFDSAPLSDGLGLVSQNFGQFWSEDAFLVLMSAVAAVHFVRTRSFEGRLALVWLVFALIGVNLGGLFNRHYFVQLLPPLCLLATDGLLAGVRLLARVPRARVLLIAPIAALALATNTDAGYYIRYSPIQISQRLYEWPVYHYQAALVDFLRKRVPEHAPFFAAYAAAPLHYLANRPSVTPYLWRRPLGTVPGAYVAVLRSVELAEPVCIVAVQAIAQPPGDSRMAVAIRRAYSLAWARPGLRVFCHSARLAKRSVH